MDPWPQKEPGTFVALTTSVMDSGTLLNVHAKLKI